MYHLSDPKDDISASLGSPRLRENCSSEIESSSGENEFSLLLSDGRTSERKESLRRHQLLSVQMVIEELSAQSDHLPKSALILVV